MKSVKSRIDSATDYRRKLYGFDTLGQIAITQKLYFQVNNLTGYRAFGQHIWHRIANGIR